MKKLKLLFCFYFIISINCNGQPTNQFSAGIGGGADFIFNKDLTSSPLAYSGFGLPIGIDIKKTKNNRLSYFELGIIAPFLTNNYQLKTKSNTNLKNWYKINLRFQLLLPVKEASNQYIGPSITSSFFLREYDFLDGISWDFMTSVNVNYAYSHQVNEKYSILPTVTLPVLGFIHRKADHTLDEQFLDDFYNKKGILKYGEWRMIFDKWFNITFSILHEIKLNDQLRISAETAINYYELKNPEKVTNLNLPIKCFINYQFQ